MNLSEIGEFGLIERIKSTFPGSLVDGSLGIGDDCAVIKGSDSDWLVTTDMLIERTHFLRGKITPYDLGWKSLAVNLSDIAAMGGIPVASFLSLGIPEDLPVEYLDEFSKGYRNLSEKWETPLLGGDTTRSERGDIVINVCILGKTFKPGQYKLRSGARPGDGIYVTGTLGDSGAGLHILLHGWDGSSTVSNHLTSSHTRPCPRMKEGKILGAMSSVHSMMDISDGIASDLKHILESSGVGGEILLETIPLSPELKTWAEKAGHNPLSAALGSGEDYELLFTAAPDSTFPFDLGVTRIGTVTKENVGEIRYLDHGEQTNFSPSGYNHFKRTSE